MQHPRFTLWRPVIGDAGRCCRFDAVAMTARPLRDGTPELIGAFLGALGIDAAPTGWTLRRFRSPFYGRAEAAHWDDRLPPSWRIAVTLAAPLTRPPAIDFAGAVSDAIDATAADPAVTGFAPPEREAAAAVTVIAAFPEATQAAVAALIAPWSLPASSIELHDAGAGPTELRVTLSPLDLPAEEARVAPVLAACEAAGGICHWTLLAACMAQRSMRAPD
jgi:hypothetical protein